MDENNNQSQINGNFTQEPARGEPVVRSPLPHDGVTNTRPTATTDNVGQRPTQISIVPDTGGHRRTDDESNVGHDLDLPDRTDRHALSTYEASRIFEEAECRVSERTIIRWCNRNKRGHRRLECAFDPNKRKYYIAEESVRKVIKEERSKGRQSELFNPDVSNTQYKANEIVGHTDERIGQRPTKTDMNDGQKEDTSGNSDQQKTVRGVEHTEQQEKRERLFDENTKLKIELARHEEQAKTKDEMMTFLRKEIDRTGEAIKQDRETYTKSLDWFRSQVEAKDSLIEKLNTDVRGLIEAPRKGSEKMDTPDNPVTAHDEGTENTADETDQRSWQALQ